MRLSSAMRRAICSDGIEHRGEVPVGESEEMAMDCLRAERSMTLSAYPPFSLFSQLYILYHHPYPCLPGQRSSEAHRPLS